MGTYSRRDFLKTGAGAAASVIAANNLLKPLRATAGSQAKSDPIVISSANGMEAAEKAMELIRDGSDALGAVIAGVNIVENDTEDTSVGYGGLPNEDGIIELDSCVMHGPTHRAGAVASLRNIKNPSQVAQVVMERTDHVLLVGEGALRFARAHGFKEEDLLTERARKIWLTWKENLSDRDDWLEPRPVNAKEVGELLETRTYHHGTITCEALDTRGNLSGVTTTSGLAFKIPGRVGDSPIIGAGLYVDNEVGAAGSTGRGEANLINCSCVMVVEYMRQGKSPEEACMAACKRIVDHNKEPRLQDADGRPSFNVKFYAINKKGEYGSCVIWEYSGKRKSQFVINDGTGSKLLDCAYLLQGKPI
jgi:N4-(beta-N-acetylglucosaminyl)-L-asparaginase